jgi:hypothetical protein
MRIAMLAHEYVPHVGGVETMVLNLAERLAHRHDVVLVTSAAAGCAASSAAQALTVHRSRCCARPKR